MAVDGAAIEAKVKEIVTKIVRKPESAFTAQSTFKELNADSLDIVQMLVALEDAFNIEIQDEELRSVSNMGEFVDYIKKKVTEKG